MPPDETADHPCQSPHGPGAHNCDNPESVETKSREVLVFDWGESGLENLHPARQTEPRLANNGPVALLDACAVSDSLVASALGDTDSVELYETARTAQDAAPAHRVAEKRPLTRVHTDLARVVSEITCRTTVHARTGLRLTEERLERVGLRGTAGDTRA